MEVASMRYNVPTRIDLRRRYRGSGASAAAERVFARLAARWRAAAIALALASTLLAPCLAVAASPSSDVPGDEYALSLDAQGNALHYFVAHRASQPADDGVTSALVAMHGHPRDANKTLTAAARAAAQAGRTDDTLIVAPLFQVASPADEHCHTVGVPRAQAGDALWTCGSWMEGGAAKGSSVTSFAALDQLLADLKRRWPRLQKVTVSGFSAGGQFVQHYIGFANPPAGVSVRYVVADPGSWLYFDAARPTPQRNGQAVDWTACGQADGGGACSFVFGVPPASAQCSDHDRWKYGIGQVPAVLGRSGQDARARYAEADIAYLEGELDTGDGPGTANRLLDRSCGAQLQGPYRLQRGLAYAAYDRQMLSTSKPRSLTVVPGCAHSVSCVFPSPAGAAVLFPAGAQ
jgi:hypothetical protein